MKTFLGIIMAISMIIVSSSAYAASVVESEGALVEITDVTNSAKLEYQASPSTTIIHDQTDNAYAIVAFSSKCVDESAGMKYHVNNNSQAVWQMPLGSTAPTSAGTPGTTIDGYTKKN